MPSITLERHPLIDLPIRFQLCEMPGKQIRVASLCPLLVIFTPLFLNSLFDCLCGFTGIEDTSISFGPVEGMTI